MVQNFIENELVILTKATIDVFLKQENSAELIALYTFYYYTAKWQKTNQPKCTTDYVSKGLNWNRHKVIKIKKKLIELGLIEDKRVVDETTKKVKGYYIKLNYKFNQKTEEEITQSAQNPPTGSETQEPSMSKSCSLDSKHINAYSTVKENSYSDGNNIYMSKNESAKTDLKKEFETIWEMYPNKKGKDKALSSYVKARKNGESYENVKKGVENYLLEIEVKGTQKSFIKHGCTWFNNKCWLDEYQTTPDKRKVARENDITRRYKTPEELERMGIVKNASFEDDEFEDIF